MPTLPELLKMTVDLRRLGPASVDRDAAAGPRPRRAAPARVSRAVAGRHQGAGLQRAHRRAEEALRGDARSSTSRSASAASPASAATCSTRRARSARSTGRSPSGSARFEELGLPARHRQARRAAARPGARHRPDRQRQVDDAGRDDRQDQHRASRPHPDDRRSDRVPAPAQELPGQPARSARRHAELHQRAARRAARRPGHRPHRRNARPRNRRSRR